MRTLSDTEALNRIHECLNGLEWSPDTLEAIAALIEATYRDSLDCPALAGLRHIEDVMAGHKAAGLFSPHRWLLLLQAGQQQSRRFAGAQDDGTAHFRVAAGDARTRVLIQHAVHDADHAQPHQRDDRVQGEHGARHLPELQHQHEHRAGQAGHAAGQRQPLSVGLLLAGLLPAPTAGDLRGGSGQPADRPEVRLTIEETLDYLPRVYSKELYGTKCDVVYQHFFDSYFGPGKSVYSQAA